MKTYLGEALKKMDIQISDEKSDMFLKYSEMLIDWNERINLTAITEPHEIILKHFCDSLSGEHFIKEGASLADIGTGAGFPGVPLAIMRDDISVLLVDSLKKRVGFLEAVISEIGLKNVSAVHLRAEEGSRKKYRDSFDVVTARAVAPLNILSEFCLPYVNAGGVFLAYKGTSAESELSGAQNAISALSAKAERIFSYTLPDTDIVHKIIPIYKIDATPKKYPRLFSKISKAPL